MGERLNKGEVFIGKNNSYYEVSRGVNGGEGGVDGARPPPAFYIDMSLNKGATY